MLGRIAKAGLVLALLWIAQTVEDILSKESDALTALDEAIDRLEAWRAAEDETDAGQIASRTARINEIMAPRPGEAVDALTGVAVPINAGGFTTPGPTSPDLTAPQG